MHGSRSRRIAIGLVAACALAGCFAAVRNATDAIPPFDHAAHKQREITCADCHLGAEKADEKHRVAFPKTDACLLCHDPVKEPAFVTFTANPRPPSYADVKFSHAKHAAEGKLDCAKCHTGSITPTLANPFAIGAMSMDTCIACHEGEKKVEKSRAGDCASCHAVLRTTTPAPNHKADWLQFRHGPIARLPDRTAVAERCDACHAARADCDACHAANPPRDHNQSFRLATHGLSASMDRDRCVTCHQADSCVRCHRSTPPRSHTPGFGSPNDGHCVRCHLPVSDSGCATCHQGAPSHLLAPPKAPSVSAHRPDTMPNQCVACHTTISHPVRLDEDCNQCHR